MKTVVLTLFSLASISISALAQTDSAEYFFKQGLAQKSAGRAALAYESFEKALHIQSQRPAYLREAGFAALELRKYELARQHFEHLHALDSNDTTSIIQLAQLHFSLRRWNEA